jgi:hypothetical protein
VFRVLRILPSLCLAAICASLMLACTLTREEQTSSEILPITDLADLGKILDRPVRLRTLVVLDIDDTLLTSAGFFGSDRWYEWQRTLSPGAAGYVPCRFDVMAMNYESGTQVATQEDAAALVNAVRTDKIMLTARSELYRGATVRELKHAGYVLPDALGSRSNGLIYEWRSSSQAPPAVVGYRDGVFMVSGQNKGFLLLDLLHRLDLTYERVVLVDDGEKNIRAMRDALALAGIDYVGLHYTRVSKSVDAQDIQAGIAGWQAWQQLLSASYPQRMQRLIHGECAY